MKAKTIRCDSDAESEGVASTSARSSGQQKEEVASTSARSSGQQKEGVASTSARSSGRQQKLSFHSTSQTTIICSTLSDGYHSQQVGFFFMFNDKFQSTKPMALYAFDDIEKS